MVHGYNYVNTIDSTTFAMIKMKEGYANLSEGLEDCFQQLNKHIQNPVIEIGEKRYELINFLCAVTTK